MNNNMRRLADPDSRIYLLVMLLFAAATFYFKLFYLAAAEVTIVFFLLIYFLISRRNKQRRLQAYIESVTYDTENAKNNTLMNFPLPIAVFRLDDSRIIWGNEMFFNMCGKTGTRLDASITDLVPDFSGKWLIEGKTKYPALLNFGDKKFQIHGNLIRPEKSDITMAFMGITYWIDVTDYDNIKIEYEKTRPVTGIIVIDNMDELTKNQADRIKNDIRDSVEEKLSIWCSGYKGIIRRYDRDRYIAFFESDSLEKMRTDGFSIVEDMHTIENPNGINTSISMGFGTEASTLPESLQFADLAIELALTRGGDQVVIKNSLNYEFFGGRGLEVEKRTKVKSRVMANTLAELIKDSSRILIMGHKFSDLDSVGAAIGINCIARKFGVKSNIVIDETNNAAIPLIEKMKTKSSYRNVFIPPRDALIHADGHTLLVVVDTNRPEQVEFPDLLYACNRVAVIDHHRVAATYIHNAVLGFIEPYASSTCELLADILQELTDKNDIQKEEAEALLAGIALDTKNFTIRTGERTFEAAAFLKRCGADTVDVKKMQQSDMADTISKYKILQNAELYHNVAIAVPAEPQNRIVAAKAADELLNISGVEASIVVAADKEGEVFASARSIGELNVQIIMEKLGGGGNRSAAAVKFSGIELSEAVTKVYKAIDEYLG